MASSPPPEDPPSGLLNRSSSFFKLIDTFALEIGELKKEMVKKSPALDQETLDLQGLDKAMSAVYLEPYCCNAAGAEKDSGYDSLRRRMSVLDRLSQTHSVWLQLSLSEEEARHILLKQPPGVKISTIMTLILTYIYVHIIIDDMAVVCRCFWFVSHQFCRERSFWCV